MSPPTPVSSRGAAFSQTAYSSRAPATTDHDQAKESW